MEEEKKEVLKERIIFEKERKKFEKFLRNLNEEGLKQLSRILYNNPANKKFIKSCAEEFDKDYGEVD